MRSLLEKKPLILLLSILALGALTILSVSLRNVSFREAQPIGRGEPTAFARSEPQSVLGPVGDVSLGSQILVWVSISILAILVTLLLSPEARKRVLRILIRMAFTYWALYFLFNRYPELLSMLTMGLTGNAPARDAQETAEAIPPPVFTPPQKTPMLSYAVTLLIILILLYLAWMLYRAWSANAPTGPTKSLDEIARVARSSLRDLSSGRESTDVIMNCYFRMSDVVADKKNIERRISMTPAEFASRLEQAGLPSDAVRRLTNLFETVRYGGRKAGPREVNEAVACLTSILQYCGEPV
jgi:hypothetical protein